MKRRPLQLVIKDGHARYEPIEPASKDVAEPKSDKMVKSPPKKKSAKRPAKKKSATKKKG